MDPNTQTGPLLRTGTDADAEGVATLHAGQIGEGFLSFLGPGFLRHLYRRIARSPDSFLLVVEQGSTLVGFIAGSTDVAALYRSFLWRDGLRAAAASGGRLLRSWRLAMETLRHGTGGAGEGAELLAVAVEPSIRGHGVGWQLVEGFLSEVDRKAVGSAHVVVASDNHRAVALYERAGFRTVEQFELHAGTTSLMMQWVAPRDPSR